MKRSFVFAYFQRTPNCIQNTETVIMCQNTTDYIKKSYIPCRRSDLSQTVYFQNIHCRKAQTVLKNSGHVPRVFLRHVSIPLVPHAGMHCIIGYHGVFLTPGVSCCLCMYVVQYEQVDQQQNEWAAEAAVRQTREINWEIDTDKSHTLWLPGSQLSAEQAAGSISYKWLSAFFLIGCQQQAGKLNLPVVESTDDKKARCAWRRLI